MNIPTIEQFAVNNYGWNFDEFGTAKEFCIEMRDMLAREIKAVKDGKETSTSYGYPNKINAVFIMENSIQIDDINKVLNNAQKGLQL